MTGRVVGTVATLAVLACAGPPDGTVEVSGTVEATEAELGFQVPGRVDSILVREGDRVEAGARLAVLDRIELTARREAARAALAAQRAHLTEPRRGSRPAEVAQAKAQLRAADERLADAVRNRNRSRNLFAGGAVSREALDRAETAATVAQAERDRLAEQLALLEEGARAEQVTAQAALVTQAEAALAQAGAALRFAEITAPFPGVITRRPREPGEVLAAGLPVVTLMNPADRWIRIYVPETAVGRVALGQSAEIAIDAFPGRIYAGEVAFIADEAEFTPRNVQTREERVKLVYRVKVRVVGDTAQDLKPGLSADVRLPPRP
jgi:HlyD family secretion protein